MGMFDYMQATCAAYNFMFIVEVEVSEKVYVKVGNV